VVDSYKQGNNREMMKSPICDVDII